MERRPLVSSLVCFGLITLSMASTSCGKDYAGGAMEEGPRKELPSAQEVAGSDEMLTIAVRYLAFTDSSGAPVAQNGAVQQMVEGMSRYWRQCAIQFSLEEYQSIDAGSIGARYNPSNYSELDEMRMATQNDSQLTVIGTGAWNRSGSLGASGSNCYSSFPGDRAEGIVCEFKSAAKDFMMAHEVGHWLNLRHTNSPSTDAVDDTHSGNVAGNLMDHVVATSHDKMTPGQCYRAREAIGSHRRNAVM